MEAVASKNRCIVLAAPNGAEKTTFARDCLPKDAGIIRFGSGSGAH